MFGALKKEQAEKILKRFSENLRFSENITPLCNNGLAYLGGDFVILPGGSPNMSYIKSVDIMLTLVPDTIPQFQKGTSPFTLTFFKLRNDDKLWRYDICSVKSGDEVMVNALLENINAKYRMIVFLLENISQQKDIAVGCEHCFVTCTGGEYRFYK